MKIITTQQFKLEYNVPEEEYQRFLSMLVEGEDISEYEVDQVYMGEKVVYVDRSS